MTPCPSSDLVLCAASGTQSVGPRRGNAVSTPDERQPVWGLMMSSYRARIAPCDPSFLLSWPRSCWQLAPQARSSPPRQSHAPIRGRPRFCGPICPLPSNRHPATSFGRRTTGLRQPRCGSSSSQVPCWIASETVRAHFSARREPAIGSGRCLMFAADIPMPLIGWCSPCRLCSARRPPGSAIPEALCR